MNTFLKLLPLANAAAFLFVVNGNGQQLYDLPPFDVSTDEWLQERASWNVVTVVPAEAPVPAASLARQMDSIPGIAFQRRGTGSMEPNLRGFTSDRIATSFNGHYLPIAAPTHTASPVNFFGPMYPGQVSVSAEFSPVTAGPVPVGGRIEIEISPDARMRDSATFTGFSNPGGYAAGLTANPLRGTDRMDAVISLHSSRAGDYESGNGQATVDEDYRAWGLLSAVETSPVDGALLDFSLNYHSQDRANNPSLPLDSDGSEALFLTAGWTQDIKDGQVVLKIGYAGISQRLTSGYRIIAQTAPIRLIQADSDAASFSMKLQYSTRLTKYVLVNAGVDYNTQNRDALRQRFMKSGAILNDRIWPDIQVDQPGGFLELSGSSPGALDWRVGLRAEQTRMDARRLDAPVEGVPGSRGDTIGDNFHAFHGSDPASAGREDWTGSAQAVLRGEVRPGLDVVCGAVYTVAPPGPGDAYRAFLNALGGGVELGNPLLDTEKKRSLSLGIQYTGERMRLSSQAWHADVDGFIQREIITADPLVYSFMNRDSRFTGWDAKMWIQPFRDTWMDALTVELAHSRSLGKGRNSGLSLPDVPPWESSIVLRWNEDMRSGPLAWFMHAGYTAGRENPQPQINPVYADTDSFIIVDIGLRARLSTHGSLHVGVSNLFDELAYPYLQPPVTTGPVMPSGGSLTGGDRIPLPGRSFSCSLVWDL